VGRGPGGEVLLFIVHYSLFIYFSLSRMVSPSFGGGGGGGFILLNRLRSYFSIIFILLKIL
jgi:hypothetical protein